MNSNIHPAEEYEHRRDVLLDFAREQGLEVIEGVYDPQAWSRAAGVFGTDSDRRPGIAAARAIAFALKRRARMPRPMVSRGVATTLTVSPYQYTETIREELERACEPHGLAAVFRDYREQYPEATRRSKAMGMYRQNYCGCVFFQDRSCGRTRGSQSRARCCEGCQGSRRGPRACGRRSCPPEEARRKSRHTPISAPPSARRSRRTSKRITTMRLAARKETRRNSPKLGAKRLKAIKEETAKRLESHERQRARLWRVQ